MTWVFAGALFLRDIAEGDYQIQGLTLDRGCRHFYATWYWYDAPKPWEATFRRAIHVWPITCHSDRPALHSPGTGSTTSRRLSGRMAVALRTQVQDQQLLRIGCAGVCRSRSELASA